MTERAQQSWRASNSSVRADGRRVNVVTMIAKFVELTWRSMVAIVALGIAATPSSMRPYLRKVAWTLFAIWLVVGSYLAVAMPSYTSRWTLILPTSSSSLSLQLGTIGHAQSVASSPFGSSSLSPKVIYKEIISSERMKAAAAQLIGMTLGEFGAARVKLVDETALMLFEISARTPELAQRKANALIEVFEQQLHSLRLDEIQRRSAVVEEGLKSYQNNLLSTRERILSHQQSTGVLSMNQFNEVSTSLEQLRRKLSDMRADVKRQQGEQALLVKQIGIDPATAAALLRLSADPVFTKFAGEFADSMSNFQSEAKRLGASNPLLNAPRTRYDNARAQLKALAAAAGLGSDSDAHILVLNGTHRSELLKAVIATQATLAGRIDELRELESEHQRLSEIVTQMSVHAARLEDLRKDHIVAEAVFSSALARLDTNKVDIYASYPMVQILAPPELPTKKSSPAPLLALAGGFLASLLGVAGWCFAWLRHIFSVRALAPKWPASSSAPVASGSDIPPSTLA